MSSSSTIGTSRVVLIYANVSSNILLSFTEFVLSDLKGLAILDCNSCRIDFTANVVFLDRVFAIMSTMLAKRKMARKV